MTPAPKAVRPGFPAASKAISAHMTRRFTPGLRLHRPLDRALGSMGSTDVGKYQELALACASLSMGLFGRT